jgi:hypothetical protein
MTEEEKTRQQFIDEYETLVLEQQAAEVELRKLKETEVELCKLKAVVKQS